MRKGKWVVDMSDGLWDFGILSARSKAAARLKFS